MSGVKLTKNGHVLPTGKAGRKHNVWSIDISFLTLCFGNSSFLFIFKI